jgi:hypothetical protein
MEGNGFQLDAFLNIIQMRNENERMELGLTSLENLDKNELVAVYGLGLTEKNMHFIRHNEKSTCFIEGNQVFTLDCVIANTELTLKFFK